WPEATGLLPAGFGREPDRVCVLELERDLQPETAEVPDAPGEIADAVTVLRLATAAAVAAGPVLFERLDWRPYGIRPVLPIAATQPPGEGAAVVAWLPALAAGAAAEVAAPGAGRRPLVGAVRRGARAAPVAGLDEALLGLRPRPGRAVAVRAAAG